MAGGYLRVDQNQVMGSPIKADQVIGRDILGRLFDNILFGESFNRWRLGTDNLQLRLYGGPGTGKVCSGHVKLCRKQFSYRDGDLISSLHLIDHLCCCRCPTPPRARVDCCHDIHPAALRLGPQYSERYPALRVESASVIYRYP